MLICGEAESGVYENSPDPLCNSSVNLKLIPDKKTIKHLSTKISDFSPKAL